MKLTEEELKQKAVEIAKRALVMPLPASLVRNLFDGIMNHYSGYDVCPYCGSPNFRSGLLRDIGKEWGKPREDLDTYIYVCSDCERRFDSPDEVEPLTCWYVRNHWADRLITAGKTLMHSRHTEYYVWECESDNAYADEVWLKIAKELYKENPDWDFWRE